MKLFVEHIINTYQRTSSMEEAVLIQNELTDALSAATPVLANRYNKEVVKAAEIEATDVSIA